MYATTTNEDDDEEHLVGIGVGIDLGTTNSAVAMMIPAKEGDGKSGRTLPTMIEIDDEGRTIPSVVAFVPTLNANSDREQISSQQITLPPWTTTDSTTTETMQWPNTDNQYQIHIGKRAIQYENNHPSSTFRNVKRVIGTGGKMAGLATGVVPNLFIQSVNGNDDVSSDNNLDALFDFLEEGHGKKSNKNKKNKNKKQKGKGKNKWSKKKQSELPKLQKQLDDARDDPALLTCNMNPSRDDAADDGASEVALRPEQISACILRKLYDTAERQHRQSDDNDDGKEVRVTRAVIGVPAYFTEAQRRATVRASELAGVPKVKLLPEPEAAALAYGSASARKSKSKEYDDAEELILVFDLGGGTFDVSILEVGGGVTEVLATVGNNRLGGTDFDKRVAEYLSACAVEHGKNMEKDDKKRKSVQNESLDGLQDAAERSDNDKKNERRKPIKDWYSQASGEVPDIILRTAEEARKCLSNQKVVEVLVPLTEDGWRQVESFGSVIGPFDKTKLDGIEGYNDDDFTTVTLDRKIFESICANELQLLLKPIREVAIMAGVLLPGEARPSFVDNAMQMALAREEEGEDFWEYEDDESDDLEEEELLIKTGKDGKQIIDDSSATNEEEMLDEQALQQIQAMDVKAQKKAQQRGRKKARDIAQRERSFRKQKQSAMEEANTASILGTQLGGGKKRQRGGGAEPTAPVNVGNERVQEGIHGRPLSRIVLVGGATRMPVIAKLLEAVVGMVPQKTVHPDEAVALGCAVQVGILDGENEGLLGGMQAVLSPMQAAIMRALAKKREKDEMDMMKDMESEGGSGDDVGEDNMEMSMMGGIGDMIVVGEFDDEDDFY